MTAPRRWMIADSLFAQHLETLCANASKATENNTHFVLGRLMRLSGSSDVFDHLLCIGLGLISLQFLRHPLSWKIN